MKAGLPFVLTGLQAAGALVAYRRLASQARRPRIEAQSPIPGQAPLPDLTIVLPVLNERRRLIRCLEALARVGPPVSRVVIVDTGSSDGTPQLARSFLPRDPRFVVMEANLPPSWWTNGKAWGLRFGLEAVETPWVLMTDADVRLEPDAPARLLSTALAYGCDVLSAAPRMALRGPLAALHASMLASLIFRIGLPGILAQSPEEVLANGQAMLARTELLRPEGLWRLAAGSWCEDITLARALHHQGARVGSVEFEGIEVAMYDSLADAWRNWPRSLALRDRVTAPAPWPGLMTVFALQALPPVTALAPRRESAWLVARTAAVLLFVLRCAVAVGAARAYPHGRFWATLAPIADAPVALRLWQAALARRHRWRGRWLGEDPC